ncbi:MAG: amidohydrolase family protein [Desulfobacterota bacterium]|nr:amidohydrolase family protein [Thermodesulfobacteriota bacterium]MDW8002239.1 amidohydrolase family protein [Deltaproteobacteria bacterium]
MSSKIFDFHTHIFPEEIIRKKEMIMEREPAFSLLYGKKNSKLVSLEGLTSYMDEEGISVAAILSFPFKDKGLLNLCNDYIVSVSKDRRFLPFIMLDLNDEKWSQNEVERCFSAGAVGIGEVASYDREFGVNDFKLLDSIAPFLREKKAILVLHVNEPVGHNYAGKTSVNFNSLYKFIERNRDLKIILAHMGGGICFYEFMPEVKELFQNVFYDMSATPYLYTDEVYSFIANYISEKVIFGSDFPLLRYSRYVDGLRKIREEKRQLVLFKNAQRLLASVTEYKL